MIYSLLILVTFSRALIPAIAAWAATPPDSQQFGPSIDIAAQRGPAIFNSVHDTLRKWGSIVHPNGMSMFLATEDGRAKDYSFDGFDTTWQHMAPLEGSQEQVQLADDGDDRHGWLHTYRTSRPLRFLYLDGLSGNKGHDGVTDTQEFLLRESKDADPRRRDVLLEEDRPPGPPGEYEMVLEVCSLLVRWHLDGMIRTEWAGFEIVKCDFPNGLEQVQAVQRADKPDGWEPPPRHRPGDGHDGDHYSDRPGEEPGPGWPRTCTTCDLDASRTLVDYSSMLSAYFFPVSLANPASNDSSLPRLVNTTADERTTIRECLGRVVKQRLGLTPAQFGWRDVADLVVRRYASALSALATATATATATTTTPTQDVQQRIDYLLQVFIDHADAEDVRDSEAVKRCTRFYLHSIPLQTETDQLIYAAFEAVNNNICTTLFHAQHLLASSSNEDNKQNTLLRIHDSIQSLIKYLSWSAFESDK
ncbi:hypothetical protein DV735_g4058, partial [Chaetothyriales sp. CBS 134920]